MAAGNKKPQNQHGKVFPIKSANASGPKMYKKQSCYLPMTTKSIVHQNLNTVSH